MKILIPWKVGLTGGFVLLILTFCSTPDEIIPKPVITITNANPRLLNENITGYVNGIIPTNFKIAVYGKINTGWHNLPSRENPLIPIAEDNSWACNLTMNQISSVSEYAIYLLPNGYIPPILVGAKIIPVKLNLVAAARTDFMVDLN